MDQEEEISMHEFARFEEKLRQQKGPEATATGALDNFAWLISCVLLFYFYFIFNCLIYSIYHIPHEVLFIYGLI